ncbi:MAG TPA: cell filamentation protein Fic [Wolbachia sp.]|nr:Fic family protein [Wolbachia endosymbiont of Pentalonia nigronervosa]HCE59728.1 cell filamentation protein Fic [Wolbachia sp.]
MLIKFVPNYTITPNIASCLMKIEAIKERVLLLPLTPTVLTSLRESARLYTTHYSTMIEGNRLKPKQIEQVLKHGDNFSRYKRDENEVKGYYAALTQVEQWAARGTPITEKIVQTLHTLVMSNGRSKIKPTPYRDGQNVICDSITRKIVYMPPEAKDVPGLMKGMINWVNESKEIPCPIIAGIAHYQFATIHPYYDGNGRTARLLTTLILYLGEYDLKGIYSLEEYYAKNLGTYYEAISIGPSHNYYMGRVEADITKWLDYFLEGMVISFDNILKFMNEAKNQGLPDQMNLIRELDPKQRKVLELFQKFNVITANQVGELFGFKSRTSAQLCKRWVEFGFFEIVDHSNKGRKYKLSKQYEDLLLK